MQATQQLKRQCSAEAALLGCYQAHPMVALDILDEARQTSAHNDALAQAC